MASEALASYALALAVAGVVATRLLGDPELQGLLELYALILLIGVFDAMARALLRVFDRFRDLAILSSLESLAGLALVCGLLVVDRSVRAVLIAYLLWDFLEAIWPRSTPKTGHRIDTSKPAIEG